MKEEINSKKSNCPNKMKRRIMSKFSQRLFGALAVVSLILSACSAGTQAPAQSEPGATQPAVVVPATGGQPSAPNSDTGLPEVDPSTLEGTIVTAGSSTVYPLAEAVIDNFSADGFTGEIKLDSIGSGGGFERFCSTGETDIATASRAIKDSEVEACQAINRQPVEFLVGLDALSVVVSNENTFVEDLTLAEIGSIFTGEAANWSDLSPDWPAEPIQLFTPGTDSGTFDFFVEEVIQKPRKLEALEDAKALVLNAANLQTSEDDNVLVQGVEGSQYAIGYFGYAYYQNNEDRLRAVSVDGVAPSLETAEDGSYSLSRPLYLYSDASILKEKPQVAGFLNYFLTHVNEWIEDVGYFPASQERMQEIYLNWLSAAQ